MKRYTASIWGNKYNQLINNGCCLVSIVAAVVLVGWGGESSYELFYHSITNANIEAVEQHIAAGADVNAKHMNGTTPLYVAALGGHKEIAELLIAKGVDVNAKNEKSWTPLHIAARSGHEEIAELLIEKGADLNAKDNDDGTPLDWAMQHPETAALLRKHGGKTGEELKAEGK